MPTHTSESSESTSHSSRGNTPLVAGPRAKNRPKPDRITNLNLPAVPENNADDDDGYEIPYDENALASSVASVDGDTPAMPRTKFSSPPAAAGLNVTPPTIDIHKVKIAPSPQILPPGEQISFFPPDGEREFSQSELISPPSDQILSQFISPPANTAGVGGTPLRTQQQQQQEQARQAAEQLLDEESRVPSPVSFVMEKQPAASPGESLGESPAESPQHSPDELERSPSLSIHSKSSSSSKSGRSIER